jgi:hypothetical protein
VVEAVAQEVEVLEAEAVAQEVGALEAGAEAGVATFQAVAREVAHQAPVNPPSNNLNSRHILSTQHSGINGISKHSNNRTLDHRNRTDLRTMLTVAAEEAVLEHRSTLPKVVH